MPISLRLTDWKNSTACTVTVRQPIFTSLVFSTIVSDKSPKVYFKVCVKLADALETKGDATAIVEQISKVESKVESISLDSLGYVEPDLSVFALKTEIPVLPEDHVTQYDEEPCGIAEVFILNLEVPSGNIALNDFP